jgi:hypothetical protein
VTRPIPLTVMKGGINRLRTKGGARSDVAYDLVNGYVTDAQTVRVRPGTARMTVLPSTTRGLCYFEEELHVFSHQQETVPAGYVNHVLTHPTDATQTLATIHFAQPFLGYLYVVAEFTNGDVYHYWLASTGVWEANHTYKLGDAVLASVDTGLLYKATRGSAPNPAWAAGVTRTIGEVVEPTTYNDFYYTVVATEGNARSGAVEPTWPTETGAQVTEESDTEGTPSSGLTFTPATSVPSSVAERYGPPRGSG